ncbi:MAG: hypothetical protein ACYS8X_09540 [Planctomycetota bacterium]
MTKRQIIDEIMHANPTAGPDFLAQFRNDDLLEYLRHLNVLRMPFSRETREQFVPELAVAAGLVDEEAPAAVADCPAAAGPQLVQRHRVRRFFADMPTPTLHEGPIAKPEAEIVSVAAHEPIESSVDETPDEAAFEEPIAEPETEIVSVAAHEPIESSVDETPDEAVFEEPIAEPEAEIVSEVAYEPVDEPVDEPTFERPAEDDLVAAAVVSPAPRADDEAMQDTWLF